MIAIELTTVTLASLPAVDGDTARLEAIRKIAAERHSKSDTDGSRRRDRQTAENNRLV